MSANKNASYAILLLPSGQLSFTYDAFVNVSPNSDESKMENTASGYGVLALFRNVCYSRSTGNKRQQISA